ncbi:MAG: nitroreductase family protein [Tateyamaria sp.]
MAHQSPKNVEQAIETRFGAPPKTGAARLESGLLASMLERGSCRSFRDKAVDPAMLDILCAAALASPTKSDLQQRDIIFLHAPEQRKKLAALVPGQPWIAKAPMIAVFCGNNRRQRLLHEWHDIPFANDHFDALFNAIADAAIALGAFVTAAEAIGLGCCPISAVRNEAHSVSKMLNLPDHVFPLAGLAIGYPDAPPLISKRLPLHATCHTDRYQEANLQETIQTYDAARAEAQPYSRQRLVEQFGLADDYAWSDDKVRQYSQPERADFGAYVRNKGFNLD